MAHLDFDLSAPWTRLAGVPMNFPSAHHPVKSVHAMRLCCALEPDEGALFRFAEAAFDAYFARQENLDDPAVPGAVTDAVGLGGAALVARTRDDDVRQRVRDNTQAVIDLGGFGSPTLVVGRDLYSRWSARPSSRPPETAARQWVLSPRERGGRQCRQTSPAPSTSTTSF